MKYFRIKGNTVEERRQYAIKMVKRTNHWKSRNVVIKFFQKDIECCKEYFKYCTPDDKDVGEWVWGHGNTTDISPTDATEVFYGELGEML